MDFNLLLWMPDILLPTKPKGFDRTKEQQAFSELLDMRSRKEIDICIPYTLPESISTKFQRNPDIKVKVFSYFRGRISVSYTFVWEDSELDKLENRALDRILTTVPSKKDHDDPAILILADFVKPNVTHLATCDVKFTKKNDMYEQCLLKDEEVDRYRKLHRRNTKLMVNLPSKILRDIKK